jgi:hypothetical protein
MSITRFTFCILLATLALAVGCAAPKPPKPTPNPLEGWHFCSLTYLDSNKSIVDDYQDYIQKLPPEQKKYAYLNHVFEDGTGQHAIQIEIPLNGIWWEHVLIYDKDGKRIKAVKYTAGGYRS